VEVWQTHEMYRVSGVDDGWDRPKSRINQAPKCTIQAQKWSNRGLWKMTLSCAANLPFQNQ
jgi:hypothetical protein